MSTFDFRILLETIGGQKTSYYSSSFVDTSTDLVLSASQVYNRITGSVSASYQNQTIFSGSNVNTSFTFKDNTLLSASLSGSIDTGSIQFTALDTNYDRLLRYKFIGDKVCNVLGLPSNQWVYVDQFRLAADNESNFLEGNIKSTNAFFSDTITFANTSNINSDIPFLIDTGSDRYVKFIDTRGIPEVALRIGYDKDDNKYEIAGSDNHTFELRGINNITASGDISASGTIFAQTFQSGDGAGGADIDFVDGIDVTGNITASGNISASGTINASSVQVNGVSVVTNITTSTTQGNFNQIKGGVAGTVQLTDLGITGNPKFNHITASGNISASGDFLNSQTIQMTAAASTLINTFNTSSFQTCKYLLQVTSASKIQSSEMLVVQNSSNAFNTEYSQINSGLNLVDFTTDVSDSDVRLLGNSSFISCSVKFNRILI